MRRNKLLSPAILGSQPLVLEFMLLHDYEHKYVNRNTPNQNPRNPPFK